MILAGEVKLPGTPEGRTPYHSALVNDAASKADNAGAEFFFTWNVNLLVLFDRKLWHLPLPKRRVQEFDPGLDLEHLENIGWNDCGPDKAFARGGAWGTKCP